MRHGSRLAILRRDAAIISHRRFADLPELLKPGDLLVVNDTKVLPARLFAHRTTGAQVEILLLHAAPGAPNIWEAMASPLRKLKVGEKLSVDMPGADPRLIEVGEIFVAENGQKRLLVNLGPAGEVHALLAGRGFAPLPPYIRRDDNTGRRAMDLERYQTVFAAAPGAVAAPTAGLHFSPELIDRLAARGIEIGSVTLHVGPGTFKPITTSVADHVVEAEQFTVPVETAHLVNRAIAEHRRVIAVGTTSCRVLESAGAEGSLTATADGSTSLYIKPGYRFRIISGLITNFHLSRSSLLVLVSTFAGHDLTMRAYREAISMRYRFYSYGDAMLIL